jgi:hypothetical protein
MTTLNTKNGQLLVKDGKLQTDCGCCGGWYCCADTKCIGDLVTSVAVTLAGNDLFQLFTLRRDQPHPIPFSEYPVLYYDTYGVLGSRLSGTVSLAKISRSMTGQSASGSWVQYTTQYRHTFAAHAGGCADSLTLTIVDGGYDGDLSSGTFGQIGIATWTLSLACNAIWHRKTTSGLSNSSQLACDSTRGTRVVTRTWGGRFDACSLAIKVNSPTYGQPSGYAGGLPQRVFFSDTPNYITTLTQDLDANPDTRYWQGDDSGSGEMSLVSMTLSLA